MSKQESLYAKGFQCLNCGHTHKNETTVCDNCEHTEIEQKGLLEISYNTFVGLGLKDKRQSSRYLK